MVPFPEAVITGRIYTEKQLVDLPSSPDPSTSPFYRSTVLLLYCSIVLLFCHPILPAIEIPAWPLFLPECRMQ